jgi:hypothetical protein
VYKNFSFSDFFIKGNLFRDDAYGSPAGGCSGFRGAIYNPQGLDIGALIELKKAGKSVAESPRRVE